MEPKGADITGRPELSVSPSWLDRFGHWAVSLPGPTWLFYLVMLVSIAVLNHVVFWIDGGLPIGSFDPSVAVFALYAVYWPVLYQHLTGSATKALAEFRPLLDVSDSDFDLLQAQLCNLPPALGLVALVLGVASPLAWLRGNLVYLLGPVALQAQTVLPLAYFQVLTVFLSAPFFGLAIRSVRQLRLVQELHRRAANIDLLDLGPAHAFSTLTARTGAGLILLLVIISFNFGGPQLITALDVVSYAALSSLAIAVFVVPLNGMQNRLRQEKRQALKQVNDMIWTASGQLFQAVGDNNYAAMPGPERAIGALLRQRDVLLKVSTWPWNPATIRGFASTLLLPILLLIVAQLLERFL